MSHFPDAPIHLTAIELHRLLRQYAEEQLREAGLVEPTHSELTAINARAQALRDYSEALEATRTVKVFSSARSITSAKRFVERVIADKASEEW